MGLAWLNLHLTDLHELCQSSWQRLLRRPAPYFIGVAGPASTFCRRELRWQNRAHGNGAAPEAVRFACFVTTAGWADFREHGSTMRNVATSQGMRRDEGYRIESRLANLYDSQFLRGVIELIQTPVLPVLLN